MNHFELFEIPLSFFPDLQQVRQNYYRLSRHYHPDLQDSESESIRALEMSSQVNEAYKILQNFEARVRYLLQVKGVLKDGDKESVSPGFLMEMMDVNENLMDAKMDGDENRILQALDEIDQVHSNLMVEWEQTCRQYDAGHAEDLLQEIKDYYLRNQYLKRLKNQVNP
ncbi:MAG: DnaJ domain-containing protein [Bacteroidetes bacterium]|nr:DnaJ domain-containing protein [Bacteroidota bacterium]